MSTKGEDITKDRIGFEKSNKALGYIYQEWYELISNFISEKEGINIELGCGASFIDQSTPVIITWFNHYYSSSRQK